jgi:5-hydroxyisourate hydrolase
MSAITTHVLDVGRGRPAPGISVQLEFLGPGGAWQALGKHSTDGDGRVRNLVPHEHVLSAGTYRLSFDVAAYFRRAHIDSFFSTIPIVFEIADVSQHYHIPLLLSPFGYSTYRGS